MTLYTFIQEKTVKNYYEVEADNEQEAYIKLQELLEIENYDGRKEWTNGIILEKAEEKDREF